MIANKICPYCSIIFEKSENNPNSRSVEHLIPNTSLTYKRNKAEGDFYACRKCNCTKGAIDELIGVITKCQSDIDELSFQTILKAINKNDNIPEKYKKMLMSANYTENGVELNLPISATDLIDYAFYLAKGLFYLKKGTPLNTDKYATIIKIYTKNFHLDFKEYYSSISSSDPIKDLEKNRYTKVIKEDECLIWNKNLNFLVVFHKYFSFGIEIKKRNHKNSQLELFSKRQIEKDLNGNY